ncbi:hypothetical protein AUJ68_02310 [Candidatus Woesearchaeota archaeon CG1_02_57_44]|nr:MAG: hypothetical protein AUJ68_02310 [Candidatus Woesearchaeota archaeon CG1_02_57_44]
MQTSRLEFQDRIEYIPLEHLRYAPGRIRQRINPEDVRSLARTFQTFGMMQPLEVNERDEVILGTRRLAAAKLVGLSPIPVIRRSVPELYSLEKQLVSDLHTRHLTILERAHAFQNLLELTGMSKYALAKYLSLSSNLICRTLAILKANPTTIALMEEGKISQRTVTSVLYRLKDKSKEDWLIGKIIREKLTVRQAEQLVAEINDTAILAKHFMRHVRSFRTSVTHFQEKQHAVGLEPCERALMEKELSLTLDLLRETRKGIASPAREG